MTNRRHCKSIHDFTQLWSLKYTYIHCWCLNTSFHLAMYFVLFQIKSIKTNYNMSVPCLINKHYCREYFISDYALKKNTYYFSGFITFSFSSLISSYTGLSFQSTFCRLMPQRTMRVLRSYILYEYLKLKHSMEHHHLLFYKM